MRRHAGYTLIEILIAAAMSVLVLGALIRVFTFGEGVEREARSSYLIREDADVVFRQLQNELRLTHLASIRRLDGDNGFAMASPVADNDLTSFELTRFAVAKWKSWVGFTVVPRDENVGNLVRWETPYEENQNVPLPPPGTAATPGDKKWSLLSNVVIPGRGPIEGKFGYDLGDQKDGGGLQLRFLRREEGKEVLSKTNPSEKSDQNHSGWTSGSTEIVDCRLQVADNSRETGKLSLYTLNFRVKPRN